MLELHKPSDQVRDDEPRTDFGHYAIGSGDPIPPRAKPEPKDAPSTVAESTAEGGSAVEPPADAETTASGAESSPGKPRAKRTHRRRRKAVARTAPSAHGLPVDAIYLLAGVSVRHGLAAVREAVANGGEVHQLVWESMGEKGKAPPLD